MEALQEFPKMDVKLLTEKGKAHCQKIDIFKGLMWFSYEDQSMAWHELSVKKVNEIVALNKKGKKASSLEEFIEEKIIDNVELFNNVVGQDSLTRFDKPKRSRNRKGKNRNRKRNKKKNA